MLIMSIYTTKINNEHVKVIELKDTKCKKIDNRPIKGFDLIPSLYACIYLCAKTKSGKSVASCHMIKQCSTTSTVVIVFSNTLYNDDNHIKLKKLCKSKNIPYLGYTSLIDNGVNVLKAFINNLKEKAELAEINDNGDSIPSDKCLFNNEDDNTGNTGGKRGHYQSPEYIIFFDDLRNEIKNPELVQLIQLHRHWKCKVIIASQYINDLVPATLQNLNYCLIFRGIPNDKLIKIHKDFDLDIPIEQFISLYKYATSDKYQFFYIDIRNELFRKNFNENIIIK